MAIVDDAARLIKAVTSASSDKSGVTARGRVTAVEGTTAWVSISGGYSRTPCEMAVSCAVDDFVVVSISGGKATVTSNVSRPSTDDTTAQKAIKNVSQVYNIAKQASNAAAQAMSDATRASEAAASASADAATAAGQAASAISSAGAAYSAATGASLSLSEVERVVGTLNWISEHGSYSLTTDTSIVDGRVY